MRCTRNEKMYYLFNIDRSKTRHMKNISVNIDLDENKKHIICMYLKSFY